MSAGCVVGEVHCLACGRYLADVAKVEEGKESEGGRLRIQGAGGRERPMVRLRDGRPFCTHCGGRAFVEYERHRPPVAPLTQHNPLRTAA